MKTIIMIFALISGAPANTRHEVPDMPKIPKNLLDSEAWKKYDTEMEKWNIDFNQWIEDRGSFLWNS